MGSVSALGHVMKLTFSSYVLLASINTICKFCVASVSLYNVGEVYIPENEYLISALTHA